MVDELYGSLSVMRDKKLGYEWPYHELSRSDTWLRWNLQLLDPST